MSDAGVSYKKATDEAKADEGIKTADQRGETVIEHDIKRCHDNRYLRRRERERGRQREGRESAWKEKEEGGEGCERALHAGRGRWSDSDRYTEKQTMVER